LAPITGDGLRASHLSREPARYRVLLARANKQAVSHGFRGKVSFATLADANESHDWRIFAEFAQVLIGIARPLHAHDPIGVDLDQSLYALDSCRYFRGRGGRFSRPKQRDTSVSTSRSILVNYLRPGCFADSISMNSRFVENPLTRAYSESSLHCAGMEYPSRSCSRLETRAYAMAPITFTITRWHFILNGFPSECRSIPRFKSFAYAVVFPECFGPTMLVRITIQKTAPAERNADQDDDQPRVRAKSADSRQRQQHSPGKAFFC
jgi:hypothetical protein